MKKKIAKSKPKSKKSSRQKTLVPQEVIEQKIFLIRGKKVMLDKDLAVIYGVSTKAFNQSVKRNVKRFPEDFMFQLNKQEMDFLRSQFVTSKRGGRRYEAYAFTEQGVAMLSSILNSDRAIEVNIQIIRTFVKLREMIISNKELRIRMDKLEEKYDKKLKVVFDVLRSLIENNSKVEKTVKKRPLGFQCRK